MIDKNLIQFIKKIYCDEKVIPLHVPYFNEKENEYVSDTIKSTFVSSVGQYVNDFEDKIAECLNVPSGRVICTVNGTSALTAALTSFGVGHGDVVITQSLSFVATSNAIASVGASPAFVDVNAGDMGLSLDSLMGFLHKYCVMRNGRTFLKESNKPVKALVPMHTFGLVTNIDEIKNLCSEWGIFLIEDAAESLGSTLNGQHAGTFGDAAIISFNGNKIITTGGGGAIVCGTDELARKVRHITTTGKRPHKWEYYHDEFAYNFRLPNLNAALGCAQIEKLGELISKKRSLAKGYQQFFANTELVFKSESDSCVSNYWLNTVECQSLGQRESLLTALNDAGILARPVWQPLHTLPMYEHCISADLPNTKHLGKVLLNLPSSVSL